MEANLSGIALRDRLRNPELGDFLADTGDSVGEALGSEEMEFSRRHRAMARVGLESQRKSVFLEKARTEPELLYEQVLHPRPPVDFNTPNWSIAGRFLNEFQGMRTVPDLLMPPEPAGRGEMWWGETRVFLPNRLGMHSVFTNEGLLMFGNLSWDSGSLFQTSYRVISQFFLGTDRMPRAKRVRSAPGGVLAGQMFGWTGGSVFFGSVFDGDQWSKCRLRLHQRPWAINPSNPLDAIPATSFGRTELTILNVDGRFRDATGAFPGGLPYPPLEIILDKQRILRIDLEIDLFIQLEGEAHIRFGSVGHSNPTLHQWTQWKLQDL